MWVVSLMLAIVISTKALVYSGNGGTGKQQIWVRDKSDISTLDGRIQAV